MTVGENNTLLATSFIPGDVEASLYEYWDSKGYFAPNDRTDREPFVVIMPPPNVTGELHLGHALFVTIEDIMVRYHRMLGDPTLWLPGADHAGIGGQWVVEKEIAKEGLTRHDLGRDVFLERMWQYMDLYRGRIREQMRIFGASCDWSRFTFTMDEGPSRAVRRMFKHLYDKGLIYRGERLISWCPRCNTALSDLEVVHKNVKGHLWHLAYPIEGSDERIVVATTRPETMLGDTAVAVHPDDTRYTHLIGKHIRLPIMDRLIPIIADDAVDSSFGSGAVKVTPAHDPNDFEMGKRHHLPNITVMTFTGEMNDNAGEFRGLTVADARVAVVERLDAENYLVKTENHDHSVGHCERCNTVVEPMISLQWFIRMEELAKPAAEVARNGELTFVPDRFKGVYLNWMENIRDWCISRQLWWGHRIPVWYRRDGSYIVSEVDLEVDPETGEPVTQDTDVLDTWFSSGQWPFSTLGWPDDTDDLHRFYPGSVMETGYEILFFWVARMVFFGIEMTGESPFHTVYLHGTVRDAEGLKMSKTKGNVLEPTELAEQFGADAVRFALASHGSAGVDMKLSLPLIEASRNFINKLWNATRFALTSTGDIDLQSSPDGAIRPTANLSIADRWILSRTEATVAETTRLLDTHQYGEAGRQLRDFVWAEFCDWYIELAKVRLRSEGADREATALTVRYVLDRILRLLHPFAPFVTEALWGVASTGETDLIVTPWPIAGPQNDESEETMTLFFDVITRIRNARSESNVEPGRWIAATVFAPNHHAEMQSLAGEFSALARVDPEQLTFVSDQPVPARQDAVIAVGDVTVLLPLAGLVDLDAERARLDKEIATAIAEMERIDRQLGNANFVERAPEKVVNDMRLRRDMVTDQLSVLQRRVAELATGV